MRTILGLNAHIPGRRLIDRLAAAGIRHLRLDAVANEPKLADDLRASLLLCDEHGIEPLITLDNHLTHTDVTRLVEWTGERLLGGVSYCLGNEPNLPKFWRGDRSAWIDRAIARAYLIKKRDPTARVVGPDLAHLSSADWHTWLREFLRRFTAPSDPVPLDAVAHHLYSETWQKAARKLDSRWPCIRTLQREIDRAGWRGEVWLTETNTTEPGNDYKLRRYVEDLLAANLGANITRLYIYEAAGDFGVLRTSDLAPRPAWFAILRHFQGTRTI